MNAFLNLKDRLDMLYNNIDAMKSLLHVVCEGINSGSTGADENSKAVYSVYMLSGQIGAELRDIIGFIDNI